MKFICILLGTIVFAVSAQARIISIQDWDGSRTSRSTQNESEVVRCAQACPGYSISITSCKT